MGTKLTLTAPGPDGTTLEFEATFSPLPFNRRTAAFLAQMMGEGEARTRQQQIEDSITLCVESLKPAHGEAEANRLVEEGFLPWPGSDLYDRIMTVAMPMMRVVEKKPEGAGV